MTDPRIPSVELKRYLDASLRETNAYHALLPYVAVIERLTRSLTTYGFEDRGGELWVPPLGKNPLPELDRLRRVEAAAKEAVAAIPRTGYETGWYAALEQLRRTVDMTARRCHFRAFGKLQCELEEGHAGDHISRIPEAAAAELAERPVEVATQMESLVAQCQALWRTNITLICVQPKGHAGDHRAANGWTFNGECIAW